MKRFLLFLFIALSSQITIHGQCPPETNQDTDGDGVLDCIDPCINEPNSIIGNLSFESDFIGWTVPQNLSNFSISEDPAHFLHGSKSLYVTAPNDTQFENHAIYSEEFTLEEGEAYNFKIPVKRIGDLDGDALRWVLIDENGVYRHFNNYYNFTSTWSFISFNNFLVNFDVYTSNKFRLRLEFGLSTVDMVVDKIEFYKTSEVVDPAYLDMNGDGFPDCVPYSSENHPDYNALMDFYNSTNGNSWNNSTNWLDNTKPISSWFGVTETNGRVTTINLNSNNLSGVIPESFSILTELEVFSIRSNSVNGAFPLSTFTNQTKLQYVDINSNFMVGFIPPEISNLTSLWYLDIGWNGFYGNIPAEMTNLANLQYAYLHNNQLSGNIPSGPGTMPNLQVLQLANNNLTGAVPDLSILPTLNYFDISNNQFIFIDLEPSYNALNISLGTNYVHAPQQWIDEPRGVIANIGETVTLDILPDLGSNLIVDWYIFDGTNYTYLDSGLTYDYTVSSEADYVDIIYFVQSSTVPTLGLHSNIISIGPSPETHPDYDALIAIYNALDGPNWGVNWDITSPISTWGSNLTFDAVTNRLIRLNISGFGASGQIPSEIGGLTELQYLDLSSNQITGSIPPEIGNLTNLNELWLFQMDLSGNVPDELWNLTNLTHLLIGAQESGQLTFTSNTVPAAISNLQNLYWLNIGGIPLDSPLPQELFALPNLTYLRIYNCGLTGELPAGLANINNVLASGNEFEGAIPQEFINSLGNYNLSIENNYFDFSDLEPLVLANNYNILGYSPQRTRDKPQNIESAPGQDIVLNVDDTDINRVSVTNALGNEYQWFKDEQPIASANGTSYTIVNAQESDSGTYYCEITNSILPELIVRRADITVTVDATMSVDSYNDFESLKIYPNPTSNILNISINRYENVPVKIYDISGRLVKEETLQNDVLQMNMKELNSGIYLLKIQLGKKSIIRRIIKQ